MIYKKYLKRPLDIVISLLLLVMLSPVLFFITVLLFVFYGKPFFIQDRPGKDSKIFRLIKFRTMHDVTDKYGELQPEFKRITLIGKLLRSLSIDELPQLFNVVKGDMSLIGPRPLLVDYLEIYNAYQKRRHDVKPGITGWAQINGRNTLSWDEKFEHDIFYINNCSLIFDIKILFLTFKKLIIRQGINQGSDVSMKKFVGFN